MTANLPATIPDAHGTVLADSPHLYTIYTLLCSGWHPVKVAVYIAQTTGVQFPAEVISAYLQTIPDEDLLPTTAITRHFRNLDVIADPVRTMHEMLLLRKHSLAQKIEAAGDAPWTATIDGDIKDVFTMAAELKGMLDGNQPAHPVDTASSKATPTLRDLARRKISSAERVTERVTFENDDTIDAEVDD